MFGTVLGDRYRILRLVGKGGFGSVYEAQDTRFSSMMVVAIKRMSGGDEESGDKTSRPLTLHQEANLLAQLRHPNLPEVRDFFEQDGSAYLVMEFIHGETLEHMRANLVEPLDENVVMEWALQLCDVLYYLHTQKQPIIFRDLKPSNIMVTEIGQIKLIDFGIARTFKANVDKDTYSLGSKGYSPLEQYGLGQSDPRSDVYGLGATLYSLLTGREPTDVLLRHANLKLLPSPRSLNGALSIATEKLLITALELDMAKRFQSVAEMFQAILASGVVPVTSLRRYISFNSFSNSFSGNTNTSEGVLKGIQGSGYPSLAPITAPPKVITDREFTPPTEVLSQSLNSPLVLVPPPPPQFPPESPPPVRTIISRRALLLGGLGIAGAATVGGMALNFLSAQKSPSSVTTASVAKAIEITFTCSTEKQMWVQAAVQAFNKTGRVDGRPVQVNLDLRGSGEGRDSLLSGKIRPVIWSPASFLELNQFVVAWQQQNPGKDIVATSGTLRPRSLVSSPLVFAVWKERAQVLLQHYGQINWSTVHDALLKKSWAEIGGQADWGGVKFGQTLPNKSNSGLLTISLLGYAFFKQQRELTITEVNDPQFLAYFHEIEDTIYEFGRSSGTFLSDVVIPHGPAEYDLVTTYENLVLTYQKQAMQIQHQPLQLFYPDLNILSDHPFVLLQGDWVTKEELNAASAFRDFLLSVPQQRLALQYGFRPAIPDVQISDKVPGNLFLKQSPDLAIQADIQPLAQVPTAQVINSLLSIWTSTYKDAQVALG